ncbi:hypothetical protein [Cellulomonas rhizosphaerae]|uniref:Uncharacterized protein n=1 Tax=Cellulomonas rhizosphaerae TaxID=2293719 RepID=A0A413RJK7_9CELL|nr:hypothetical protein [Cellulomonas rhizosphaerae]RHA38718.1 hypothetical protein D1825_13370 [Cellulomonas rhizosphaerae]
MTLHRHSWTPNPVLDVEHEHHDPDAAAFVCADPECPATAEACTSPLRRDGKTVPCGRVLLTAGRTCDDCVSRARNNLREIRDMYRQLPDVIAAAAGLHAIRYDQRGSSKTKKPTDTSIIGGTAFVMAGGGATFTRAGRNETHIDPALLEAEAADPPSVLAVLTGWEDTWRGEQDQNAAMRTSVDAAVEYLVLHTTWAAQHSGLWAEYLVDLAGLRGRLRNLTGQSSAPQQAGVPCPYCSGSIIQRWGRSGLDDVHECDTCHLTWASEAHFMLAVREAHSALPQTHPDQLVTIEDAKRIYKGRVRPNLFDTWVKRGRLDAEVDEHGMPVRDVRGQFLYRLGDIDARVQRKAAG